MGPGDHNNFSLSSKRKKEIKLCALSCASLVAQMVKNMPSLQCRKPRFNPWVRKIPQRKKWQTTLLFLPGKFHGQKSLASYSPWGRKKLNITEQLNTHTHTHTHSCARWYLGRTRWRVTGHFPLVLLLWHINLQHTTCPSLQGHGFPMTSPFKKILAAPHSLWVGS